MARDHFNALIDEQLRCRAVASAARRCQLYADHDGPHAYGWREPRGCRYRMLRWDNGALSRQFSESKANRLSESYALDRHGIWIDGLIGRHADRNFVQLITIGARRKPHIGNDEWQELHGCNGTSA
jgi:hypothetical protein